MSSNLFWEKQFPVLHLNGEGARKFLHGQTTANILSKEDGEIFLSCWLSRTAKVRALVEIKLDKDNASIVVLGGKIDEIYQSFDSVIFPSDKVNLEKTREIRRIQIIDSELSDMTSKIFWLNCDQELPMILESFSKASQIEVECWRLRKGLPIGDLEINGEYNPFELGMEKIVSLEKGCYLGQESIAKLSRLSSVRRKLMFWESDELIAPGNNLMRFCSEDGLAKKLGLITSSLGLIDRNGSIGLALISQNSLSSNEFYVDSPEKQIQIRSIDSGLENW